MDQAPYPEVYQLHVWIRQISPMIWRRFLVRSDSTLTDLHNILQIAFGLSDFHLHRFRIRGPDFNFRPQSLMQSAKKATAPLLDLIDVN